MCVQLRLETLVPMDGQQLLCFRKETPYKAEECKSRPNFCADGLLQSACNHSGLLHRVPLGTGCHCMIAWLVADSGSQGSGVYQNLQATGLIGIWHSTLTQQSPNSFTIWNFQPRVLLCLPDPAERADDSNSCKLLCHFCCSIECAWYYV